MKTWFPPILLFLASGLMLVQKGYLRFDERPTHTVEARVLEDVEDIAASIPIPFVRDAIETAGYDWPREHKLLLFVVGTKACAGCIIEVEDFGAYVTEEQSIHVAPIALIPSDSLPAAKRFAKVIELAFPAVPSSEPALLDAFGFSPDRPSRQVAVLVNAQDGRVIKHMHIPSTLTPRSVKRAFLRR